MEMGIKGKLALVTGGGRGLGHAIAKGLAQEGAHVVVTSRRKEDLAGLVDEMGGAKSGHGFYAMDITDDGAPDKLADMVLADHGEPDILINNVGGNLDKTDPFHNLNDWRSVFRINLEVTVELNNRFVPLMQKKGWGRVCQVSSISALENQGPPAYCAAKAALTAYTRSFGRFVAPQGVIVTSILPGAVFTEGGYWDLASKDRPQHVEKYLKDRMAIQRFGKTEEISDVVVFLCSEKASFCVGSAFLVDGGQGRIFYAQEG
ncbi:MAG: SDR family oxidoreductase [Fibrobacterota bacterium]|nr:SDR family oxidoreductase [Fibrobacterota bacterium]